MPVEYTYYHLYNRGCNREPIFFKDDHYLFLLRKIKENYQKFNLRIIAYCLMPNHYHLMVGAPVESSEPSEGFSESSCPNHKFAFQPSEGCTKVENVLKPSEGFTEGSCSNHKFTFQPSEGCPKVECTL